MRKKPLSQFNLTLRKKMSMAPIAYRLWTYLREEKSRYGLVFVDPCTKRHTTSLHGIPAGGTGAGSIGRSYKGPFMRWQIFPRICEDKPVFANQFSIFASRPNGEKFSSALNPKDPEFSQFYTLGLDSGREKFDIPCVVS